MMACIVYAKVPTQALRPKFDSIQKKIANSITRNVVGSNKTTKNKNKLFCRIVNFCNLKPLNFTVFFETEQA